MLTFVLPTGKRLKEFLFWTFFSNISAKQGEPEKSEIAKTFCNDGGYLSKVELANSMFCFKFLLRELYSSQCSSNMLNAAKLPNIN